MESPHIFQNSSPTREESNETLFFKKKKKKKRFPKKPITRIVQTKETKVGYVTRAPEFLPLLPNPRDSS